MPLPVLLKTDTIYECVFEVRFAAGNPSMADLLPGMLFQRLRQYFFTSRQLPMFAFPQALREADPNLRYQPTHALEGKELTLTFGPYVVGMSFPKPYGGWKVVQPRILECMRAALDTQLPGAPERFSLKYINLLTQGRNELDLSQLKVRLTLDDFEISGSVAIRAELERNGCAAVIEVVNRAMLHDAKARKAAHDKPGIALSVDVIKAGPFENFIGQLPELLEAVHTTEKEIFFGLLEPATLTKLGPVYDEAKR